MVPPLSSGSAKARLYAFQLTLLYGILRWAIRNSTIDGAAFPIHYDSDTNLH